MRRLAPALCAALLAVFSAAQTPAPDPVEEAYRRGDLPALRRYAEAGDLRAQRVLVLVYDSGALGAPVDFAEAFRWERMAASQGDVESARRVGFAYLYGEKDPPVAKDPKQAVPFLSAACNGSDPRACEALGTLFLEGAEGVPRDPKEGERWRVLGQDAAEADRALQRASRFSLGYDKPPKDPMEGVLRLKKAVETRADPADLYCMGLLFLRGPGGFPRNTADGARLVALAADRGDGDALLFLARCYRYGLGYPADPAQARAWLKKAADKGHPRAQAWLGEMLVDGEGGARDFAAAQPLLLEARKAREPVWALLYRLDLERELPPAGDPKRLPPLGDLAWTEARDRGGEFAAGQCRARFAAKPSPLDLSEPWLNYVGYRLLDRGRPQDAAPLFRLNAEQYPGSADAWDGLAESEAALGQSDQAIAHYKKSLALDPSNQNAADQIARLSKTVADAARPAQPADDLWGDEGGEGDDIPGWLLDALAEGAKKEGAPAGGAAGPAAEAAAAEKALLDAARALNEARAALAQAAPGAQAGPKATCDLAALNFGTAKERFLKSHGGTGPEGQKALQAFAEKGGFAPLLAPPKP